jgi:L-seryl-tRNA(Ser) seleniumtransferase
MIKQIRKFFGGKFMLSERQKESLRSLPPVHEILQDPSIGEYINQISHDILMEAIQKTLLDIRVSIKNSFQKDESITRQQILSKVRQRLDHTLRSRLRNVINATGTVLHTNLGRAVLSEDAYHAVLSIAKNYNNLEYDIEAGQRGSRHSLVEDLICSITGAEAAMVVNNNAAAVFLILREMGRDREVIVSRGQLVEIGGSFRVFEIMKESGAHLVEIGTTNKTHRYDYERVIREQTGLIMKVHTSNFKIVGFTEEVPIEELVEIGQRHQVPVYEDLGSGVLYDLKQKGVGSEPIVQDAIKAGVDIVSFSGDKLLGGPQAGIIAGKKQWIERLKKNQLARVLRVDKMTLAALEATLRSYLHPEEAAKKIPTLQMLLKSEETLKQDAQQLAGSLNPGFNRIGKVNIISGESEVGGGSMPGFMLPTTLVCLTPAVMSPSQLEKRLRLGNPSIIVRVQKEQIFIDPRTLMPGDANEIISRLNSINP